MTDREKLVELLMDKPFGRATEEEETAHIEDVADYLLSNGAVVREKGENLKDDTPSLFECSKCGWFDSDTYTGDSSVYNFCPNCGADMRKGENG